MNKPLLLCERNMKNTVLYEAKETHWKHLFSLTKTIYYLLSNYLHHKKHLTNYYNKGLSLDHSIFCNRIAFFHITYPITKWDRKQLQKLGRGMGNNTLKKNSPPHGVVGSSAEPRGVIMEAAVEDGPGVHELSLEHVGVCVVEPHRLQKPPEPDQTRRIRELGF